MTLKSAAKMCGDTERGREMYVFVFLDLPFYSFIDPSIYDASIDLYNHIYTHV